MADPISAVGTLASTGFGSVHSTLAVSPTTVGDVLVFSGVVAGTSITLATVSGGGVTTWTRILTPVQFTSPNVATQSMEMWLGEVTTVGSSTITVTFTTTTTNSALYSQQFTSNGGAGTVWALDPGETGSKNNSTASTTIAFPTLVPGGTNRAYIGLGYAGGTGSLTGATAGYTVQLDANHNPFIYNASVPASSQSPTSVQTSAKSNTIAALVTATNPLKAPPILVTSLISRFRAASY